jgi:hypothetical protein
MNKFFAILLIFLMLSCKTKQKALVNEDKTIILNETVTNIIKNHYAVNRNFKTAYIKASVDYKDSNRSLNLGAEIRIKKDEIILVSVRILGITVAKAIITPTQVRYYEKPGNKFFEGDYKTLSNWLGTDLDFQKVQNMLLGQAIDNLADAKYTMTVEENALKLEEDIKSNIIKAFVFEPNTFYLKRQEITQQEPLKKLNVNYLDYKTYTEAVLPEELLIFAIQNNETIEISLKYKNATFNEELTFPYSVPNGYNQISIK